MRNRLIQLVHVAKRELNLDEDIYRSVLKDITEKSSCAKMSIKELESVIDHFKTVGFKVKTRKRYSPKTTSNTLGEVGKIRALWITMYKAGFIQDGSEQALDKFISRSLKAPQGISYHAAFLKKDQAHIVIERLKQWQKRLSNKTKQESNV